MGTFWELSLLGRESLFLPFEVDFLGLEGKVDGKYLHSFDTRTLFKFYVYSFRTWNGLIV